jgi:hypothetical protein
MNKDTPPRIAAVIAAVALAVPLRVAPSLAQADDTQNFVTTQPQPRETLAHADEMQSVERLACTPDDTEPIELSGQAECIAACRAGGPVIARYCAGLPTPQFQALCFAAAAVGTISCINFCYARFVD